MHMNINNFNVMCIKLILNELKLLRIEKKLQYFQITRRAIL